MFSSIYLTNHQILTNYFSNKNIIHTYNSLKYIVIYQSLYLDFAEMAELGLDFIDP